MEGSGINTRDVIFATRLIARLYLFLTGRGGVGLAEFQRE